ncbi:MAG: hypothetical protein UT41_C0001G0060 [Candidatus Wolfebacteria bacterium GW2011_GWC2_39_22]|uniref:Uncharacterized protein n=1 Tax=Candidatus Wolfebacteria bacterium GW2011_GWC2_39_22 TaxID=1619013 RepID=A0A0G0NI62_9BACT|nr:MAG: hypothetical protein UT41_C0001G0060 [Candidatus Wolfebacteria bacterium GW2011_GWC2_39_22]HBI25721.1 hypothetical protein [Candidatus Wolfebacteria bacterium]
MRQSWVRIVVRAFLLKLVIAEVIVVVAALFSTGIFWLCASIIPLHSSLLYDALFLELWLVLSLCAPCSVAYVIWHRVLLMKRLSNEWDVSRADVAYAICTKRIHEEEGFSEWDRNVFLSALGCERAEDVRRDER